MSILFNWLKIAALTFLIAFQASGADGDIALGPGDVLRISVFEQPDLSLEVRVSESGTITYPLIGEVVVGGVAPAEAERRIARLLESGGFLKNPHVSIIVSQLQSQQVSVLGYVNRPGRYPIDGTRTLADLIALAGGVSIEGGDLITLVQTSGGQPVRKLVDIAEMMRTGNLAENVAVAGGDIVYVERARRFYIYGEVQRPSQYRLEHNMTVLQALSVGGGLTLRGTERGVRIKRRDETGEFKIIKAQHNDFVQPDDVIYVQESLF